MKQSYNYLEVGVTITENLKNSKNSNQISLLAFFIHTVRSINRAKTDTFARDVLKNCLAGNLCILTFKNKSTQG